MNQYPANLYLQTIAWLLVVWAAGACTLTEGELKPGVVQSASPIETGPITADSAAEGMPVQATAGTQCETSAGCGVGGSSPLSAGSESAREAELTLDGRSQAAAGGAAATTDAAVEPSCSSNADCAGGTCELGLCQPSCVDSGRSGSETSIDCGGPCAACAAGQRCQSDSDCASQACEDGRCCGGELADCTRCARRLAGGNTCSFAGNAAATCDAFLQCLADNVEVCPRRLASGCSRQPGDVCDVQRFGGDSGAAIQRADRILGSAGCRF